MDELNHAQIRTEVTRRIIEALEAGTPPWRRPWRPGDVGWGPRNATSGRRYRGINFIVLAAQGFADPRWCTPKQAEKRGWRVKDGAKTVPACWFGRGRFTRGSGGRPADVPRFVTVLRSFQLFNVEQLEGVPPPRPKTPPGPPLESVERLLSATRVSVRAGEASAYYRPDLDVIGMPSREFFHSEPDWAATLLHELAHWTGHASRLAREFGSWGSPGYAREELRAEMASAMLAAELGVSGELIGHASYVASWIKVLGKDPAEIFRASGDAQRIADFLQDFLAEPKAVALSAASAIKDGVDLGGAGDWMSSTGRMPPLASRWYSTTASDCRSRSGGGRRALRRRTAVMGQRELADGQGPIRRRPSPGVRANALTS